VATPEELAEDRRRCLAAKAKQFTPMPKSEGKCTKAATDRAAEIATLASLVAHAS
jgi:hypothetical protein